MRRSSMMNAPCSGLRPSQSSGIAWLAGLSAESWGRGLKLLLAALSIASATFREALADFVEELAGDDGTVVVGFVLGDGDSERDTAFVGCQAFDDGVKGQTAMHLLELVH